MFGSQSRHRRLVTHVTLSDADFADRGRTDLPQSICDWAAVSPDLLTSVIRRAPRAREVIAEFEPEISGPANDEHMLGSACRSESGTMSPSTIRLA